MYRLSLPAVLTLIGVSPLVGAADFDRTVAADPRGVVEISNISGRVTVTGWDQPQVAVRGTLGAGVERVEVVSSEKNRTVVKVLVPENCRGNCEARLDVRVPKQSEVRASTVSADLETKGLLGPQRLNTVSGDLQAQLAGAAFEGRTVSGEIRLRGSGQSGETRLETVSGDAELRDGAGRVEAITTSGDVHLEVDPAEHVRLRSTSGDVVFRGRLAAGGSVEAESVSGDVRLDARAKSGFEYELTSFSGDIDNCFGRKAERSTYGPGRRLNGAVGEGKARVRAKTMSGDIDLCDR